MEICGQTGREYDTNNPSMGCGGEMDLAEEDVMKVGAISFCVLCYENLSEADQEWVATEEKVYKCSDCDAWVTDTEECCGADLDESRNEDPEEVDECAQCHAKVVVVWVNKVGFTIGDCEDCGLMLCRKCLDNDQTWNDPIMRLLGLTNRP